MTKFVVFLLTFLAIPGIAFSGTIQGAAQYTAKFTPPAPIKTGKFKKACGDEIPNQSLIVNGTGLQNVVVSIEGKVRGGKPGKYHIDQKNCRYEPHVIALMKESELVIHSSDPINHNIHTYSFENDPINVMFTPGQDDFTQEFEEPEIIKVECDLHHWMTAWIVVTENAYFAVSDRDGKFTIPDLPPGKYTLTAWHETLGSISREISVGDGIVKADFDFSEMTPQVSQK
ncbi:MAG: hypothetical protein COV67_03995 [Nitrospinae bacterium CG11_big_fil_rev_8_21_14_0_20_56_8]|nr:MAG: hypothetical protein COV67_03995 [Nitrospinae bacterium CG11_big_fil_rev_8_21_14_0_20_56_8]